MYVLYGGLTNILFVVKRGEIVRSYRTFKIVAIFWALAFPAFIWFVFMKSDPEVKPVVNVEPASKRPVESVDPPMDTLTRSVDISEETPAPTSPGDALLAEVLKLGPAEETPLPAESASLYAATEEVSTADYTAADNGSFVPSSSTSSTTPSATSSSSQPATASSYASTSSASAATSGSGGAGGSSSGGTSGSSTAAAEDGSSSSEGGLPAPTTVSETPSGTSTSTGGGIGVVPSADLYKPHNIGVFFLYPGELTLKGRPLPLSVAMENLLKYDAFFSAGTIAKLHPQAWRTLRTEYPDIPATQYVTSFTVRPDSPTSYLDYEYVEKYHPEWFLLKDEQHATAQDYRNPDKRIRWNRSDSADWNYNRFFLDVGNPAFQDWAVAEFLKKLDPLTGVNARIRYSGIGADNVLLTVWANGKTTLYPDWKYTGRSSEWNQAFFSYLKKLHDALKAQGYILVVNHTTDYSSNRDGSEWQDLMAVVDGMIDEQALVSTAGLFGGDMWEWSLKHHEEILDKGLYDWWECNFDQKDPDKDYDDFLYIYTSFLLVRNKEHSLFAVYKCKDEIITDSWYEEYTLPIGEPVGSRYEKDGCWWRDYEYGQVVVNPSSVRCMIPLDSGTYTLDWRTKKKITRLTLEPLSATILLPTGYTVN